MFSKSMLLSVIPVVFCASSACAESFQVMPSLAVGNAESEAKAVTELIKSAVPMVGKHEVVESPSEADFVLEPKVVRLGEAYTVSLLKKGKKGVEFSAQIKASRAEELDLVARRLTRAVIDEVAIDRDAPVGSVVESEKSRLDSRTKAPGRWVLGLGPAGAAGLGRADAMVAFTGGRFWQVTDTDSVRLVADLGGSLASESSAGLVVLGLGATHAFSDDNFAPYLGGELGYGTFENAGGSSRNGMVLTAVAGVELWRSSTVGMNVELRVRSLTSTIEGRVPVVAGLGVHIAH